MQLKYHIYPFNTPLRFYTDTCLLNCYPLTQKHPKRSSNQFGTLNPSQIIIQITVYFTLGIIHVYSNQATPLVGPRLLLEQPVYVSLSVLYMITFWDKVPGWRLAKLTFNHTTPNLCHLSGHHSFDDLSRQERMNHLQPSGTRKSKQDEKIS